MVGGLADDSSSLSPGVYTVVNVVSVAVVAEVPSGGKFALLDASIEVSVLAAVLVWSEAAWCSLAASSDMRYNFYGVCVVTVVSDELPDPIISTGAAVTTVDKDAEGASGAPE